MGKFTAQRFSAFGTLAAVAALAACGGGGGSSGAPGVHTTTPAPITTAPPAGSGLAPASFSILIPGSGSSSTSRRTQTVNAATTTISFVLLKTNAAGVTLPQTPVSFNVAVGSPLCITAAGGARSCTIGINAPIGSDIYSVQTFDVNGNKLGSSAVNLSVLQNVANTATITLGGTLAGVLISAITQNAISGSAQVLDVTSGPTSMRVVVIGFDSQGNVILTPDTFSTPITLELFNLGTIDDEQQDFDNSTKRSTKNITPVLQVTVAYANPNGGPATATTTDIGAPITVTSPNDVVTLTALSPAPQFDTGFAFLAAVGTPPAVLPTAPPTAAPGLAPALSALLLEIMAAPTVATSPPTSTPTSPPTPTPTPTPPTITWSSQSGSSLFTAANGGIPASYQFLSPTDNPAILGITDTAGPTTITFSIAPPSCTALFSMPASFPTSSPATGNPSTATLTLAPSGAGSTASAGGSCTVTATDSTTNHISAPITIFINNVSGTIQ